MVRLEVSPRSWPATEACSGRVSKHTTRVWPRVLPRPRPSAPGGSASPTADRRVPSAPRVPPGRREHNRALRFHKVNGIVPALRTRTARRAHTLARLRPTWPPPAPPCCHDEVPAPRPRQSSSPLAHRLPAGRPWFSQSSAQRCCGRERTTGFCARPSVPRPCSEPGASASRDRQAPEPVRTMLLRSGVATVHNENRGVGVGLRAANGKRRRLRFGSSSSAHRPWGVCHQQGLGPL